MSDTRMRIKPMRESRDDEESVPITIRSTTGMRRRISALADTGIYGSTVEEVCERLVCRALQDMERNNGVQHS